VTGRRQLVVLDLSSLAPRGALRALELDRIRSVPNGPLFVGLNTGAHAVFWLFDVASRRQRWRSVGNVGLEQLSFADSGRVVVARDVTGVGFTSETSTGQRLTTEGVRSAPPAFSPDERLIAHEVVTEQGETVLQLTERATGKAIARSSACDDRFAMTFDAAGTRLAIGGTRKLCMMHVPSLRVVARAMLDVGSGDADGWDRVTPDFVSEGRVSFAGRRDGLAALLDASSLTRIWTGQGRLVRAGARAVIDIGSTTLGEIGPSGGVTMRPASLEDLAQVNATASSRALRPDGATVQRLESLFCALDGWLLPLPCP